MILITVNHTELEGITARDITDTLGQSAADRRGFVLDLVWIG